MKGIIISKEIIMSEEPLRRELLKPLITGGDVEWFIQDEK